MVDTADASAGRDEHRALVHPGVAEDLRIDEHDVDHREERGCAGEELGANVGAVRLEMELALEKAAGTPGVVSLMVNPPIE